MSTREVKGHAAHASHTADTPSVANSPRAPRRDLQAFLHAARVVEERSSRYALVGPAFWGVLFLALLASTLLLHSSVRAAERLLVLVTTQPLFPPLILSGLLIALYLAVAAAVLLAHERDRGTLEVLLFGPANEGVVLLGTFAAHLRLCLLAMLPVLGWVVAAALILNVPLTFTLLLLALALSAAAATFIAFALLTACLGGRARTAIAFFLVITLSLAAIQLSDQLVALALASGYSGESLLVISKWLERLSTVTRLVSPFALVAQSSDFLMAQQYGAYARAVAQMVALTTVLLVAAAWLFRRKRGAL